MNAPKETHKSTGVGDHAEAVQRAKWRVQALLFEKRVLAETKKAAGISKINNVRKALAELTAAKAPRDFVCESILTYAEKLGKK